MEIQKQNTREPKEKPEVSESKSTTPKIKSYMKFKTPSDKSPTKKAKTDNVQQKTPVKMDLLTETAMQSWSDNSQTDIIKPTEGEPTEVIEIDDGQDMRLVYEDTEWPSESPPSKEETEAAERAEAANVDAQKPEKSPEREAVPPGGGATPASSGFPRRAEVRPCAAAAPGPRAPRRVSFVTLSSPKNAKRC